MMRSINEPAYARWRTILRAKIARKLHWQFPAVSEAEVDRLASRGSELGFGMEIPHSAGEVISEEQLNSLLRHEIQIFGSLWPVGNEMGAPSALIPPGYRQIDWLGHYRHSQGGDIKLPWELARLQHLPQMAWHAFRHQSNAAVINAVGVELQAQVADFSHHNPPARGVNWQCAMDVGIRVSNILLARELLRAVDWRPAAEFDRLLVRTAIEHGRFIHRNLEWYRVGRGNHYLANLAGLLFCALWLPPTAEADGWFRFAASELQSEVHRQFLADGANFEGSVFYHRLSLEIVAFSWAAIRRAHYKQGLAPPEVPALQEALTKGLRFLGDLTDNSGNGVQFGDHDSGRLFKIAPTFIELGGRRLENALDTRDTLGLLGFFSGQIPATADAALFRALAGPLPKGIALAPAIPLVSTEKRNARALPTPPPGSLREFSVPAVSPGAFRTGCYPGFGAYFWKSELLEAWIRCGPPSGDGHHGHAHFDQLHLEVRVNGRPLTFDPGSLAYTGDFATRNYFRGPDAHFIPRLPRVEGLAAQDVDCFRYPGLPTGHCLEMTAEHFIGYYELGAEKAFRRVQFIPGKILVWDWAEGMLGETSPRQGQISWGYGVRLPWPWES